MFVLCLLSANYLPFVLILYMCALCFILFQTVIHRLSMSFITLKEMNIEGAVMVENVIVLGVGAQSR